MESSMNATYGTSPPTTSETSPKFISAPALASGPTPSGAPDGPTTAPSGPAASLASLSARQAKDLGLLTSGTCGPLASISSASAALELSLVLRASWVMSTSGGSLLARLLADFEAGRSTVISEHLRGTPVMVNDVVRAVYAVTQQMIYGANNWGVMHFGSSDVCSEAVFARKIQDMVQAEAGRQLSFEEVDAETDNSAVLEVRRLRDCFGLQPRSWRQGLRPSVRRWLDRRGLLVPAEASVTEGS